MSEFLLNVTVGDGKYTVFQKEGEGLKALRHGEPWRDCCGDNLIYALAAEVETLRTELAELRRVPPTTDVAVRQDVQKSASSAWSLHEAGLEGPLTFQAAVNAACVIEGCKEADLAAAQLLASLAGMPEIPPLFARFTGLGGSKYERENAGKVFVIGALYEVQSGRIGTFRTVLKLKDIPGMWNSALFECDIFGGHPCISNSYSGLHKIETKGREEG